MSLMFYISCAVQITYREHHHVPPSAQIHSDCCQGNAGIEELFLLLELHFHVLYLTPAVPQYHSMFLSQAVKTTGKHTTLLFPLSNPNVILLSSLKHFSKHLKAEAKAALLVGKNFRQQKSTFFFGLLRHQTLSMLLFQLKRQHRGHQFLI